MEYLIATLVIEGIIFLGFMLIWMIFECGRSVSNKLNNHEDNKLKTKKQLRKEFEKMKHNEWKKQFEKDFEEWASDYIKKEAEKAI